MEFVKKNIVTVCFFSVAFIITLILAYMVFDKHGSMTQSMDEVEKIKNEIKSLISKHPAPLKENLDSMKADVADYNRKLIEIRSLFGQPYKHALDVFSAALGTKSEDLQLEFESFWKADDGKTASPEERLKNFEEFKKYSPENLTQALKEFSAVVSKQTVEKVDENNVQDFLLCALGYPRNMKETECKSYMVHIQDGLIKKLEERGVTLVFLRAGGGPDSKRKIHFGFGDYDSRMPGALETPFIIRHWNMLEDIAGRIIYTGIKQVNAIGRTNTLAGDEDRGYLRFKYSLVVTSDMASIRNFVNCLMDAYKQNMVYIIKDINIERIDDEAKKLIDKNVTSKTALVSGREQPVAVDAKAKDIPVDPEEKLPFYEKSNYGEVVLGNASTCRASIEFDYVLFVGNELKNKK